MQRKHINISLQVCLIVCDDRDDDSKGDNKTEAAKRFCEDLTENK